MWHDAFNHLWELSGVVNIFFHLYSNAILWFFQERITLCCLMQINNLLLHSKQNDSQRKMSGKSNWLQMKVTPQTRVTNVLFRWRKRLYLSTLIYFPVTFFPNSTVILKWQGLIVKLPLPNLPHRSSADNVWWKVQVFWWVELIRNF